LKSPVTMFAVALLATTSLPAMDGDMHAHVTPDNLHSTFNSVGSLSPDPPVSTVGIGDPAPDFSFESHDNLWRHLHDFLIQGNVLLVFAPTDEQMKTLEQEREQLMDRGIIPVAVLDRKDGATWSLMQKLHLNYSLLADPQSVIGAQFNVCDLNTRRAVPSWFMLDRSGRVRGLGRNTLPQGDFVALATAALGLPKDGISLPASAH
jgi:peroxiredoxin